jgi:phosphate transport system substrate-binding protein
MILHDFGQDTFVAPNNYFTLSAARQEEELAKLPEPEA